MKNDKKNICEKSQISIVIVNYNAGSLLCVNVNMALTQARQVVVVDNASSDSSLELLESAHRANPQLKIVRNEANLGFAAGCNIGMLHSTEPYILYLNPDCVLAPDSLHHMLKTMNSNPNAGMVGGLLLGMDGMEQGGGRRAVPTPWRSFVRAFGLARLASRWPRLFDDFHMHTQPLPESPVTVEAISGALMLVRRIAQEEVGSWDEGYFLHCEDLDLCMRFRKNKWDILFDPAAPAIHVQGTCSKSRPVFVEWHKHKGMVRFYRKFFRHQYPFMLMWIVMLGVWLRFVIVAGVKVYRKTASHIVSPTRVFERPTAGAWRNKFSVAAVSCTLVPVATVAEPSTAARKTVIPVSAKLQAKVGAHSEQTTVEHQSSYAKIHW